MRRYVTIIALCVGCITAANAQTFTQRIQKTNAGEGKVTVTHSQDIDNLVNGTDDSKTTDSNTDEKATKAAQERPTRTMRDSTIAHVTDTIGTTVDTRKKVMRGGYKVWGYRVQVYAGGNQRTHRQKAQQTGNSIKAAFPDQPVYVHFYSPRWICRMGNYRTYEEAFQILSSVKKLGFNAATIVKEKITVYN